MARKIEELWEVKGEDYFINRLGVLMHIERVDTSKPLIIPKILGLSSKRYTQQPVFAKQLSRESLETYVLLKLKRKVENSLQQDFADMGRVEVANALIFPNGKQNLHQ